MTPADRLRIIVREDNVAAMEYGLAYAPEWRTFDVPMTPELAEYLTPPTHSGVQRVIVAAEVLKEAPDDPR